MLPCKSRRCRALLSCLLDGNALHSYGIGGWPESWGGRLLGFSSVKAGISGQGLYFYTIGDICLSKCNFKKNYENCTLPFNWKHELGNFG